MPSSSAGSASTAGTRTSQRLPPDATVAFLSPTGWGNLGDAAILASLIHGVRRRIPRARIVGFTMNPSDTTLRHGIEAHTLAGYSLPYYPVREPDPIATAMPATQVSPLRPSRWREGIRGIRAALQRLPIRGALRMAVLAPVRLIREPGHTRRSRELLRGASLLVVAGGGQLDSVWGGVLGHPYVLWRWGRLARELGVRYVFASVGTGGLSRASRALILRALALAASRSYRDEASRALLRAPSITTGDLIVPDLAYAVPLVVPTTAERPRLVIGVSPMNYALPTHWPEEDAGRYGRHVNGFARLAELALADGHEVVIFTTDNDAPAVASMMRGLSHLPSEERERVRSESTMTLASLFAVLGRVDVVVAARLHGVMLAHIAHRPVLAIAHERKVRTLMEDLGQQAYCIDIESFDPVVGYERLLSLVAERETLTRQIVDRVAHNRELVERQFDALFGASVRDVTDPH